MSELSFLSVYYTDTDYAMTKKTNQEEYSDMLKKI